MYGINGLKSTGIKKSVVFSIPTEGVKGGVSATLNGETIESFQSLSLEMKNELRDLVSQARNQALRDSQWENVRIIYYKGRKPEECDSVFPASRDISTMYKSVLDTSIIPSKIYADGSCVYMIPINIKVDKNGGTEKKVINIT